MEDILLVTLQHRGGMLLQCTLCVEVHGISDRQAVVYLIVLNGTNGYMAMECLQSNHGKDKQAIVS